MHTDRQTDRQASAYAGKRAPIRTCACATKALCGRASERLFFYDTSNGTHLRLLRQKKNCLNARPCVFLLRPTNARAYMGMRTCVLENNIHLIIQCTRARAQCKVRFHPFAFAKMPHASAQCPRDNGYACACVGIRMRANTCSSRDQSDTPARIQP